MDDFNTITLEFEDEHLNQLIVQLNQVFNSGQKNFAFKCKTIFNVWNYCKNNYFRAKINREYYNANRLLALFGIDKKSISRHRNVYIRFMESSDTDTNLRPAFVAFAPSKLFELLVLSDKTLETYLEKKIIDSTMSVKEIRKIIKELKETDNTSEVVSDEASELDEDKIPLAYDPSKTYEFDYFQQQTKNQLINIIMSLQEYVHKKGKVKNGKN